jgi:hypothetical protein
VVVAKDRVEGIPQRLPQSEEGEDDALVVVVDEEEATHHVMCL